MADAACEVWFYHLERSGADALLPELMDKTLARGWRALVLAGDPDRRGALSERLWGWRPESFLAHGLSEDAGAARQPILLSADGVNLNGAQALVLVDGADPPSLDGYARCLDLFDGRDETAVQAARARWRNAKAQGAKVSYWRQAEQGGWEKRA